MRCVFQVTLEAAQTTAVSVRYATADGTATAGADYVAASGAVRFEPGETERTVAGRRCSTTPTTRAPRPWR